MNFDIRAGKPAHIGCGLYPATGTVFCKAVDKVTDAPSLKATELHASFVMSGSALRVVIEDTNATRGAILFAGEFVRDGAK